MRGRALIESISWKYAIGEVLLIFVGVSIALAATSWYEERRERAEESRILTQLRAALELDSEELNLDLAAQREIHTQITGLLAYMDDGEPYSEALLPAFRAVRRWHGIRANSAPYEALKSRGLGLISEPDLRLNLILYYESRFPTVVETYVNDRAFVSEHIVPYYLEHFRAVGDAVQEPVDYDALRKDLRYRNICVTKLGRLENFILPNYGRTLDLNEQIRADITRILEERA